MIVKDKMLIAVFIFAKQRFILLFKMVAAVASASGHKLK